MAELVWDKTGERFYETGVKNGVLYPYTNGAYGTGVAWNGLTAVNENPSGAEANPLFADDIKYLNLMSAEEFGFTIEAYTYPDEFAACDGSLEISTGTGNGAVLAGQQNRKSFGFTYTTTIGNDTEGNDKGYKIHLCYGCLASPSSRDNATINDSPEAMTLSWEVSTTPVSITGVTGLKPTAHVVIDSTKFTTDAQKAKLEQIKGKLYGTASTNPSLPTPDELIELLVA